MENHNQEIEDKAMLLQLATPSVDMKEKAIIWLNLLKYERESNNLIIKERAMRPIIEINKLYYWFQTHQSMLIIQKKHSQK